ncbi:MAG: hypothetical protein E7676_01905 [Ruminococcaceae bacterium]|nr:hypothetical protein [Oscillospiraceae bacterium]
MKRIISLLLAVALICASLVSCGPGGDTNMHKIMHAMAKEGTIAYSVYSDEADCYNYATNPDVAYNDNINHKTVKAWADNVNYKNSVSFYASCVEVVENQSLANFRVKIVWDAKENTLTLTMYEGYDYRVWDFAKNEFSWALGFEVIDEDKEFVFDMNDYYQNGELLESDATFDISEFTIKNNGKVNGCEKIFINDMIELLNEALDGLNEVYSAKGYPIK